MSDALLIDGTREALNPSFLGLKELWPSHPLEVTELAEE